MNASPTMKTMQPAGLNTSPAIPGKTRVQLTDETDTTTGTGEAIRDKLTSMIQTRPGVSLIVATALGGLTAWIIKRRM